MSFRIGQKVICIDDEPHKRYIPNCYPPDAFRDGMDGLRRGEIYTVSGHYDFYGVPVIYLEELDRGTQLDGSKAGYAAVRFRPVTDISIFTAMLKTQKIDA